MPVLHKWEIVAECERWYWTPVIQTDIMCLTVAQLFHISTIISSYFTEIQDTKRNAHVSSFTMTQSVAMSVGHLRLSNIGRMAYTLERKRQPETLRWQETVRERENMRKAKKANKIETKQFDARFSWTNPLARNSANELPTLTDAYPHNATVSRIVLQRIKWCHHVIRYETVKFRNSTSTQTCMTFKWSRFFDRVHARHPSCNLLCEWV